MYPATKYTIKTGINLPSSIPERKDGIPSPNKASGNPQPITTKIAISAMSNAEYSFLFIDAINLFRNGEKIIKIIYAVTNQ